MESHPSDCRAREGQTRCWPRPQQGWCRALTEPVSELRVDRQELQQVGDKAPAEAGPGLVAVSHRLAVPHRLPNDPAIRVEEDAVAVGGHDAGRHVGRQPFRKLRALYVTRTTDK